MTTERKRETIEERGARLAKNHAGLIGTPLGRENVIFVAKKEQLAQGEKLKPFFLNRRRHSVKYDSLGNIYFFSWRQIITESMGEMEILDRRSQAQEKRLRKKIPKKKELRRWVPERVEGGIETAIRRCGHVLESRELAQAQQAVQIAQEMSSSYIIGEVTRNNIAQLAEETERRLNESGLCAPRLKTKVQMRNRLVAAMNFDSLGRLNPQAARMRLLSAYITAYEREVVMGLTTEKVNADLAILVYERETTRWRMELFAKELDRMAGLDKFRRGHVVFSPEWQQKSSKREKEYQAKTLTDVLTSLVKGILSNVRVKPYLTPAMFAQVGIFGYRTENENYFRELLGEKLMKRLLGEKPVVELIAENNFSQTKERLKVYYWLTQLVLDKYSRLFSE